MTQFLTQNFSVRNDLNLNSLRISGDLTVGGNEVIEGNLTVMGTISPAFTPPGVSTVINGTIGVNTDFTVIQPANSVLESITLVNTGATNIVTGAAANDDLNLTIGVGASFVNAMGVTPLIDGPGIIWVSGVALPLFMGSQPAVAAVSSALTDPFAPADGMIGGPATSSSVVGFVWIPGTAPLFTVAQRNLNFRFTPAGTNPLATTSSVSVLCTFQSFA